MYKDNLFMFLVKIVIAIIGVVILSLTTQYFNPSIYGSYLLISGLVNVSVVVFNSWIGSVVLRYFDENTQNRGVFNTNILLCTILTTIICLAFNIISLKVFDEYFLLNSNEVLLIISIYIFLKSYFETYEKFLRVSRDMILYGLCNLIYWFTNLLFLQLLFLYYKNLDLEKMFIPQIISLVIFNVLATYYSKSYIGIKVTNISWNFNKKMILYGTPMIGVWGMGWLSNYSDRYFIAYFCNHFDVGVYSTAYAVSQGSLGIFISSLSVTFFPNLVKIWNKKGRVGINEYINRFIHYYLVFLVPAVFGLSLISLKLYGTLIDERYVGGNIIIGITSLGFFFMGINNMLYKIWQIEEKNINLLYFSLLTFTINSLFNVIFIPEYGIVAAALSTTFSYFITGVILFNRIKDRFDFRVDVKLLVNIFIGLLFIYVFFIYTYYYIFTIWDIFIFCIFIGFLYLLLQIFLGSLHNEKRVFISFFKKVKKCFVDTKSVAIVGVDGTGKSSVVNGLKDYYNNECILQYMGYKNFNLKIVEQILNSENKSFLKKILVPVVIYIEFIYRWYSCVVEDKLVIYDRYIYEIYINSYGIKHYLYKLLYYWLFPKPTIIVYLYCDINTSLKRKNDIYDENKFRLMKKRFDLEFFNKENILGLSTDEYTCDDVVSIIVNKIERSI